MLRPCEFTLQTWNKRDKDDITGIFHGKKASKLSLHLIHFSFLCNLTLNFVFNSFASGLFSKIGWSRRNKKRERYNSPMRQRTKKKKWFWGTKNTCYGKLGAFKRKKGGETPFLCKKIGKPAKNIDVGWNSRKLKHLFQKPGHFLPLERFG